jgi:signal transduction histidine kinase
MENEGRSELPPERQSPVPSSGEADIDARIEVYQRRLRRLSSELLLAEARERREIASDLHDHIGQALAYVSQKVIVLKGNSIFSGMGEDFDEILSILRQTIKYTRDLTVEISPPVLYELGLPAAIEWLCERTVKRHGLAVSSRSDGDPWPIEEEISVFIFKAVQELINNVIKHAGAKNIEIISEWRWPDLSVTVRDDGRGFDPMALEAGMAEDCCFGLFNIRERISSIGGTMKIDSRPGNGTNISISAPCGNTEGRKR